MKKIFLIIFIALLAMCISSFADVALAKDYANFESFYKEGNFWGWVIGGIFAVVGIAAVVLSGGTASPIVAGIGSAVGGMMGLSGAAATSAGLAFLGGGSLAAGGFGMLGGTVLISAVLEGTFLAGSQYVDAIGRESTYKELCEQVKDYPNFPPIKNNSGPTEIGIVVKILNKNYDVTQPNSIPQNQKAVSDAIYELNKYRPEEDSFYKINYKEVMRREQLRVDSLLALLYFMENDYKSAYSMAQSAINNFNGVKDDGPASVPNFIIASAGLITQEISPEDSIVLFSSVIGNESESPILPLLYSIYISRAGATKVINDRFLKSLISTTSRIENKDIAPVVDSQLMMAILARLWDNYQSIMTIGDNIQQFNLQKAKTRCRDNLKEYEAILIMAKSFHNRFPSNTPEEKDFSWRTSHSIQKYDDDLVELRQIVSKIESLSENEPEIDNKQDNLTKNSDTDGKALLIFVVMGAIIFILFIIKRTKKS